MKKLFFLLIAIVACWNVYATDVSGQITTSTTWTTANSPYVVTATVTVNPGVTLTIQSGVEVRFANGTSLYVRGTLNASGVTFTSNTGTTAGLWSKIELAGGSVANLLDINVMYAQYPIQINGVCNFNISGANSFANNTYQGVYIYGSTINSNFTLPKINVPYLISGINVTNGAKLTIAPGNTLKFLFRTGLSVSAGSLNAIGTESEPILFTSVRDADAGGYTETGGATPNFWYGLDFANGDSTVNKLKYCAIRYGGHSYYNGEASNVEVSENAGVSITNCTIEKSQRALWIKSGGAVKLTNSTLNGIEYPLAMRADAVLDVTGSNIDFTETQYKAILLAGGAYMVNNAHLKIIPFNNAPNMAYANNDWIGVPPGKTLTIDPGVVIKGFNSYGRMEVHGKLIAEGSADKPIVFTSMHDDNYGDPGDSNNNGVATSPAFEQWAGMVFYPDATAGSSLKYCNFRYVNFPHGISFLDETVYPHATLSFFDVSPTVDNCSFFECNYGVKAYGISTATIKNSTFSNVKITPVAFNASAHPILENNTWGANIKKRALGLLGQKTGSTGKVSKLNDAGYTNLTYFLLDHWTIPQGINVEIDPGIVVKVGDGCHIHVRGGLKIAGTADERIVFTEMRDDNFGVPADMEGDGNASQPAINRWGGIAYYNGCDTEFSQINYADFRYGGYHGLGGTYTYTSGLDPLTNANTLHNTWRSGVLTFSRTAVNVQNSTFFSCGHGLAYYGPEATGLATNVRIENSDHSPIVQTWSAKPTFNNVEFVNNANQAIYLQDSRIDYNVTLTKTAGIIGSNTPENAVYISSNTHINTSANVQVSPGLIFKGTGFYVDGTLKLNGTAVERITLTSIHDDSKGGDTNNNGNSTTPWKGNWHYDYFGITFRNTTGENSIKFTDIAYTYHGICFLSSVATVEDCKIEQCSDKGVSIQGTSNAVIRRTAFNNLQVPVHKHAFSTASLHEGNTASNVSIMGIELIGETFNTSGTLPLYTFAGNTDITYWLTQTLTVGSGTTLTIPAGASFKRNLDNYLYNCFDVQGKLNIVGTAEKPVVITDQRDDNYGSPLDFNQDGTVTQNYGRYNHTFINFNSGSSGTLEHLVLKSNGYGVITAGASPTLRNVLFDNLSRGVRMTGIGTAPVIENSVFNNVTFPLETSLLCFPASLTGNTFSGSSYKGIKVMNETLNQNVTVNPLPFGEMTNASYIFENYVVNAELTINPGVKCKFLDYTGMTVNRWLKAIGTAEKPIVFTSIYDDYYGGDTNADSTASVANGSYWYGIQFADASIDADCQLKHVIVKNAYEAVTTTGASPTLEYVTFYTNRNAVHATGASNPVINNCDFVGMSQRAVNNVNKSFIIQAQNCWWGSAEGPVVATVPSGTRQAISEGVNVTPIFTSGLNQPLIGDVSTNGTVQAYDASLVLQAAVSAITLNPAQTIAADASGDGSITAYDATLILEYVAGINSNMPGSLKALRYIEPSLTVGSGEITRENDLLLPLVLKGMPSSVGVDMVLTFNPTLLQAIEILPAINTGFMQATRVDNENGRIYLAAASTDGKAGEDWNMVRFRVSDNVKADFQTNISAELLLVNEKNETSAATAGTVIFRSPTGFDVGDYDVEVRCFPNPATDVIYLLGVSNEAKVSIFNISGQKIQTVVLSKNKLNISSFSNGLYFMEIEHNGKVQKLKFLKK